MILRAIVHPAVEGGYWAEVPALPGCFTQGESLDEVREHLAEAIEGWLKAGDSIDELATGDQLLEFAVLKTPVTLPTGTVAGHYASDPYLTGDDLYLFPDGRFLYLKWGCLEPRTIHARGWWSIRDGFVELASDGKIPEEDGPQDARYLPLATGNTNRPMMLMGAKSEYQFFCENVAGADGSGPDFLLTLCTKKRVKSILPEGGAALYRKLMRESWRPAYFAPAVTGRH